MSVCLLVAAPAYAHGDAARELARRRGAHNEPVDLSDC